MKFQWGVLCVLAALSTAPIIATPITTTPTLGFVGVETNVPVSGLDDIVVYNSTGIQGCSTSAGTPICTNVTFKNTTLLVNGNVTLNLGDIAPGFSETYTFANGVFGGGTITSIMLTTTLSATTVLDDLNNTYTLEAAISIAGAAIDGSLTPIVGMPATVMTPEPQSALLFTLGLLSFSAYPVSKRLKRHLSAPRV